MAFNWGSAPPTPRKLGWMLVDKCSLNHLKIRQACRYPHTVLLWVYLEVEKKVKLLVLYFFFFKKALNLTYTGLFEVKLKGSIPKLGVHPCEMRWPRGDKSLQAFSALTNFFLDCCPVREWISCSNRVMTASSLYTAYWMVVTAVSSPVEWHSSLGAGCFVSHAHVAHATQCPTATTKGYVNTIHY